MSSELTIVANKEANKEAKMDEVDAQMPSGVYVSSLCSEGYMYDDANARPNFALCTPPSPHLPASPFPLTRPHIAPHTPRSAAFPHRPAELPCHSTPLQPLSLVNAAPSCPPFICGQRKATVWCASQRCWRWNKGTALFSPHYSPH